MKDGQRVAFSGLRGALLEDMAALEAVDLGVFIPGFGALTSPAMVERWEAFAEAMG